MPVRKIEKMFDKLLKTLLVTQIDIKKFDMGNRAAGIRVRRVMQEVRAAAKGIRSEIQRIKRIKSEQRKRGVKE